MNFSHILRCLFTAWAILPLTSCEGLFEGVYDEPADTVIDQAEGVLYVDASDWTLWHYIDFRNPEWVSYPIPTGQSAESSGRDGIYTYWYDIFGEGVSKREFLGFTHTSPQPEPDRWSIAVHRNNVRTNGGGVCVTSFRSVDEVPSDSAYLNSLEYTSDSWNETDVWVMQDRMLSGIIGNQGIEVNSLLSLWLAVEIPPMPPAFVMNPQVFVLRLADGSHAALQLRDYMDAAGKKCCLTINYRYPL